MFAVLSPPLLAIRALFARRVPSLSGTLRSLTLGTFVAGPLAGGGVELGRLYWQQIGETKLVEKAARIKANVGQRRADDYTAIGAVLGSVRSIFSLFASFPSLPPTLSLSSVSPSHAL